MQRGRRRAVGRWGGRAVGRWGDRGVGRGGAGRDQRVAGQLPGPRCDHAGPERALQQRLDRLVVSHVGQYRDLPGQGLRRGLLRPIEPGGVGSLVLSGQPGGAGPQDGRGGRHRLAVLRPAQLGLRNGSDGCERSDQPAELVDQATECGRLPGRPGGPVRRLGQPVSQSGHGFLGRAGACLRRLLVPGEDGIGHSGQGATGAGRVAAQRPAPLRRPDEHDRADSRPGRQPPAGQPPGDGRDRGRDRDRQHEGQHRRRSSGREVAVDNPGEQDEEPDHGHGRRGQPDVSRAQGPHHDQYRAADPQAQISDEAAHRRTAEVNEHQHRERPEGREDRRLRLLDQLKGHGEDGRHDDRGAGGALQRVQAWIGDLRPSQSHDLDALPHHRRPAEPPGCLGIIIACRAAC